RAGTAPREASGLPLLAPAQFEGGTGRDARSAAHPVDRARFGHGPSLERSGGSPPDRAPGSPPARPTRSAAAGSEAPAALPRRPARGPHRVRLSGSARRSARTPGHAPSP